MALAKAVIEVLDGGEVLIAQFNPTEYNLNKGAQIAEIAIPGIDSPVLQFIRGQNEKLSLDFYFDTTRRGSGENAVDVRTLTRPFYQLVKLRSATHAIPRVRFIWGSLSFKAIVESVSRKFTLFNPLGLPLRATLSISFREYKTLEEQLAEANLQSSDHSKQRTVRRGDTLEGIAADEYGDSRVWRRIADANSDVLPAVLRPRPGAVLIIPRDDGSFGEALS